MTNLTKPILEINKQIAARQLSAIKLAEESIAKAEEANPEIFAFLDFYADKALEMARRVDEKVKNNEKIHTLAGIPTALKDNYNWTDTRTTASSSILAEYISPYNATVTQRLLDSDAIIIGKTNMDAFAHGSSTETSDFGVTLNPYDKNRVAGGSSGGSAAAVAAKIVPYSIGSETAGSVRGPASWCGLYGFAPTYGRISRSGIVAMGSSLDRPGVFANSVADCAIVTDVIAGHDRYDATSIQEKNTNYFKNLSNENKKLVIGVPTVFLDSRINAQVSSRIQEILKKFEAQGAKLKEIELLDPKYSMAVYTIVCRSEVSSNLARIDGIRYGHIAQAQAESIIDQIANNRGEGFGNEAKQRSMTGAYALSTGFYDAYYKKAQKVRTLIINDFHKAFEEVDLIVGPTMPEVAPKVGVTKNNPLYGELADILTEPSALAGLPCISVPAGEDSEGLPIGMQIIGPQFAEQKVLDLACFYEKNVKI